MASGASGTNFSDVATTLTNPPVDVNLTAISGDSRPLQEWLTTFHLASVVLDPYTNEAAWILQTARRVLNHFSGAAVRTNFILTCGPEEARQFLGPIADEILAFCDPNRVFIKALGLEELPAFVLLRSDVTVAASAQGWNATEWQKVADAIAELTSWTSTHLPAAGDPGSFKGTPALG